MKTTIIMFFVLSVCLSGCGPSSLPEGFPVEVGDSCEAAGQEIYFEGLYRGERRTCANYYCWSFIRFYPDCTYTAAASLYETPQKDSMIGKENFTIGVYSLENSTIKMKSEINQAVGEVDGKSLSLTTYVLSTKKVNDNTYTYIPVKAIRDDLYNSFEGEEQEAPVKQKSP
jgi:hypothetical protein